MDALQNYESARAALAAWVAQRFPIDEPVTIEKDHQRLTGKVSGYYADHADWVEVVIGRDQAPWYTTPVLVTVRELIAWNAEPAEHDIGGEGG